MGSFVYTVILSPIFAVEYVHNTCSNSPPRISKGQSKPILKKITFLGSSEKVLLFVTHCQSASSHIVCTNIHHTYDSFDDHDELDESALIRIIVSSLLGLLGLLFDDVELSLFLCNPRLLLSCGEHCGELRKLTDADSLFWYILFII